jgi:UDP-N-acetylmuramoyl-L-alanyl-D-glutamate--2,6-diaminopimelate ligase
MNGSIVVPTPPGWARDLFTVGVTGTNGKSTTTTWIAAALAASGAPVVRATTLGFFVDDEELSLERTYDGFLECMRIGHERGARFATIELTSEALARGFAKAWPCRVGVFTNLTHDHLDAHGSPEHYLASKAQLFVSLEPGGVAVLNARDEASALIAEILPEGVRRVTYGVPSRGEACLDEDVSVTGIALDWSGTRIECMMHGSPLGLSVRAIGEVHAENALAAWLGAEAAGIPRDEALARIARAPAPPGRFEVVSTAPHVVVDYAHTPDALARTLSTARTLASRVAGARLFVVFGAGGKRDREKREPMGRSASVADVVILTSDNPRDEDPKDIAAAIAKGLVGHGDVRTVLDRGHAIRAAISEARDGDVVVLAGMGHEREQHVGHRRIAFSDVDVAKEAVAARF